MHDENNKGKKNTNFPGIPKEGQGTSNNAGSKFDPSIQGRKVYARQTSDDAGS